MRRLSALLGRLSLDPFPSLTPWPPHSSGKWAYYTAWLYCSLCMAIFLVRTLKRIIFQEARNYGG